MTLEDYVVVEMGYEKYLLPSSKVQIFISLMKEMIHVQMCWADDVSFYERTKHHNFAISNPQYELKEGAEG